MSESAVPLTEPREGLPPVVVDQAGLEDAVERLAAGSGPVAVDAERASGYRYSQRAYLVQLRRAGAGTILIDPIPLPDLSAVGDALAEAEWVLHAANQDLWCLSEVGMQPRRLFDTELAGRLLGHERVGLGPLTEEVLGYTLEKGHSAADWSSRPLPESWLRYAALDVELLVDLRDVLAHELVEQGKKEWAEEEFAAVIKATAPPRTRTDPWRRTSGLHKVRDRRKLAIVRELWEARDALSQQRDIAPGRVLPDAAIIDIALDPPASVDALLSRPIFRGRNQRRESDRWFTAISRAQELSTTDWPAQTLPAEGPPPARSWPSRAPEAAARLKAGRDVMAALSEKHAMPVENLLTPELLRRLAWKPPEPLDAAMVDSVLAAAGARPWQRRLVARPIVEAFLRAAAEPRADTIVTGE